MFRTAAVAIVACALASCGPGSAAKATTADPRNDPDAPKRAPYIVSESAGIVLTATDAGHLYWIDDAGLKRRPHGDAEVEAELVTEKFTTDSGALLIVGDTAYHFTDVTVTSVKLDVKHAEPVVLATLPTSIDAFTIAADGDVYVAVAGEVLEVAAGQAPRVVASGVGAIKDVFADGDYIYVATDDGVSASAPPPPPNPYYAPTPAPASVGSLHKVPRDGGKAVKLATGQPLPGALGVSDGRLYWVSSAGTSAVASVPIAGGEVRVEAPGRGETLAVDGGGLIYRLSSGVIVEHRAEARQVAFVPDGTWTLDYSGSVTLSPDWIYLTANRTMTGAVAILALPRQIQAIQIPFALAHGFMHLLADDDAVYWVENDPETGRYAIVRGDPTTGEHEQLADVETSITEVTIGAGQVYFHDGYTISQVPTGGGEVREFDRSDSWVTGINVHRNHVYWSDGSTIYAHKRRGGTTFAIARNDQYYGYGYGYGGDGGGDLVFDDDFLYTTGFGQGGTGVFQISERGEIKLLWDGGGASYPGKDLLLLGDELFFTAGAGSGTLTLMKLSLDGDATQLYRGRGDGYSTDLVEGAGMLYLQQLDGDHYEITRIDPSTGEGVTVLRIYNMGEGSLASDDRAVYFGMYAHESIYRIPHDAPAVPEVGWAPIVE